MAVIETRKVGSIDSSFSRRMCASSGVVPLGYHDRRAAVAQSCRRRADRMLQCPGDTRFRRLAFKLLIDCRQRRRLLRFVQRDYSSKSRAKSTN
ncbi:MAG: hypothetical protein GPOALKHO_001313 [Sodalis sp.]|nr:MAG: hypothetical protein GPOALKHO_001313 [Sodalis sp.]